MMKKILTLSFSLLMLFALSSCKKNDKESNLQGNWELRRIEGIQVAGVDPNFKAGNGNILKFTASTVEWYENNQRRVSGTYTLKPDVRRINNLQSNYSLTVSTSDNSSPMELFLNLDGKKLVVFMGAIAADGTESHYEKQ